MNDDTFNGKKRTHRRKRSNDIGEFKGLIQSFSEKNSTYDSDIYNAFAGIAHYITTELRTSLCHGIPGAYFDWLLLWTTLNPLERRECAPSWSWSGWIGGSWPRVWDWYNRSISKIRKAQRERNWIIWYERMAHESIECSRVFDHNEPSGSVKKRLEKRLARSGFHLDCTNEVPSPRTLLNAPKYYEDTLTLNPNPGSGFLQFWTISVRFRLDSPTSIAKNDGSENKCSRVYDLRSQLS